MKLNDTMVLNILSTLCPNWDSTRSKASLSKLTKRDIYYNREKAGCYVKLANQLVNIECDFKNDLLMFDTSWDTRGAEIYSLQEVLPELAVKSKPQSKSKKQSTSKDKYHKIRKRKPKEHKNQVDELIDRFGRY